jgi:uncharacterized protein YkwD
MKTLTTALRTARCRRSGPVALAALFLAAPAPAAGVEEPTAKWVLDGLQRERSAAGFAELQHRPELDAVARERASRVAGRPHDQRLTMNQSIEEQLRDAGIHYRAASLHLDLLRGYTQPAAAFLRRWRESSQAWSKLLDPGNEGIGLAVSTADDGWIILATVLVQDLQLPENLREIEARTVDLVNHVRREHGLDALTNQPKLNQVARAHSEDMAQRGYFSHVSPEGKDVAHRVREHGLRYRRVAENIQMSRGTKDAVQAAIDSWMNSKSHREAILDPEVVETGVGVAVTEEGQIYFTQVFMTPAEARR